MYDIQDPPEVFPPCRGGGLGWLCDLESYASGSLTTGM
jgi:hypothetical protein